MRSKHWGAAALAVAACATVAAGCGGGKGTGGSGASAGPSSLTLGTLLPLTGDLSAIAPPIDNAVKLAAMAASKAGIKVTTRSGDTAGDRRCQAASRHDAFYETVVGDVKNVHAGQLFLAQLREHRHQRG